jgi:hypothetical protein
VIEDPSKPIPPSNASSSSAALIENDLSWPRMSGTRSEADGVLVDERLDVVGGGGCSVLMGGEPSGARLTAG